MTDAIASSWPGRSRRSPSASRASRRTSAEASRDESRAGPAPRAPRYRRGASASASASALVLLLSRAVAPLPALRRRPGLRRGLDVAEDRRQQELAKRRRSLRELVDTLLVPIARRRRAPRAIEQPARQRFLLLECAKRGPQGVLEPGVLGGKQRPGGVAVADAAPESEAFVADLPEHAAAVGTAEDGRRPVRRMAHASSRFHGLHLGLQRLAGRLIHRHVPLG